MRPICKVHRRFFKVPNFAVKMPWVAELFDILPTNLFVGSMSNMLLR